VRRFFKKQSAVAQTESPLAWPLPLAAFAVSVWVAAVSYSVLVLVFAYLWISTPSNSSSFGSTLISALISFIHLHLVPIEISNLTISIYPLAGSLGLLWLIQIATKRAIRSVIFYHQASVLGLIAAIALMYGSLLGVLGLLAGPAINPNQALFTGFVFGLVGALVAILRSESEPILEIPKPKLNAGDRTRVWLKPQSPYELLKDLWSSVPAAIRIGLEYGWRIWFGLLALGLVVLIVVAGFRFSEVTGLISLISTDTSSIVLVSLWTVLYLPVLLIWTVQVLMGLTLQIGTESLLSIFEQTIAPLPVVPVLGLIPNQLPGYSPFLLIAVAVSLLISTRRLFAGHLRASFDLKYVGQVLLGSWISVVLLMLASLIFSTGSIGFGRFEFLGANILQAIWISSAWVFFSIAFRAFVWWLTARRAQVQVSTE
jgi:Family of unknown function (DUF6350)